MLHALRHRNIVQFYGACLEPDCFFIATELMTGAQCLPHTNESHHWQVNAISAKEIKIVGDLAQTGEFA